MDVTEPVAKLLDRRVRRSTVIALVGASEDRSKYGNIILRDLLRKGFRVLPVNPNSRQVLGMKTSATLADARALSPISIADFVVPPEASLSIVRSLDGSEADVLWFQPGSYDPAVIEAAKASFEHVVAGPCIMVEAE
ncbi:MAG: CoA-binding protein [Deltaproteobacteria bacterium]|nr:CoA-binding protein [Deltaproteobacteria bacterium]